MTIHTILVSMHIPRPLCDACSSPAGVKAYLEQSGVWPAGARLDRWRLSEKAPGYEVEIDVDVPLPSEVLR
jgi:hypothetical protein